MIVLRVVIRPIRGIERVVIRRSAARIVDGHVSRNGVDAATVDSDILSTFENRHGGGFGGHEIVSDKNVNQDVIPR